LRKRLVIYFNLTSNLNTKTLHWSIFEKLWASHKSLGAEVYFW